MSQDRINSIFQFIQNNWNASPLRPDYIRAFRRVLPASEIDSENYHRQLDWILLPGLCCQAAGGEPSSTDEIAAAWLLFYTAAHIFDCIEDEDQLDENLAQFGPGVNINIATGMVISASSMVNGLYQVSHTREVAQELGKDFFGSILIMASGQHMDLISEQIEIEKWNEIAEAKSGSFFSLACKSGARLGTKDVHKINAYSDYGLNLGIMLQILDDLEDLKSANDPENPILEGGLRCSLAVAYALEVLPDNEGRQLLSWLSSGSQDNNTVEHVVNLLDKCGAILFLQTELERHRNLGLGALERTQSDSPALGHLAKYLSDMRGD